MEIVKVVPHSPEWHSHRRNHRNASDVPAMLGISPYKTRAQLLREVATGIVPDVDAATQARFDAGHRLEALYRPIAEEVAGCEFFPVVGKTGQYSASFDGLSMCGKILFEHKTMNKKLEEFFCEIGSEYEYQLDEIYRAQMEHQLMVSGAERCLFAASSGDKNNLISQGHVWYYPDAELRKRIIAGWDVFAQDVANYKPEQAAPVAVAEVIDSLPALFINLSGQVVSSNLKQWQDVVESRIKAIKTELVNDQDFADAKAMVKFLADGEKRLEIVKNKALGQTESIGDLFKAIDSIKADMRVKRLALDKTVSAQEETIKSGIVSSRQAIIDKALSEANAGLKGQYLIGRYGDIPGAIKGKRTLASITAAADTAVASAKAEIKIETDRIASNLDVFLTHAEGFNFLFSADKIELIRKMDFEIRDIVMNRIHDFKEATTQKEHMARAEAASKFKEELCSPAKSQEEAATPQIMPKKEAEQYDANETCVREFIASRNLPDDQADFLRLHLLAFVNFQMTWM